MRWDLVYVADDLTVVRHECFAVAMVMALGSEFGEWSDVGLSDECLVGPLEDQWTAMIRCLKVVVEE